MHDLLNQPEVAQAMLDAAEAKLARGSDDPVLRLRAGDLARNCGDLTRARDHYLVLAPHNPRARLLARLMAGDPDPALLTLAQPGPVPFLRLNDFLSNDQVTAIWAKIALGAYDMVPSKVGYAELSRVDPAVRGSRAMRDSRPFGPLIRPAVESALAATGAARLFGLEADRLSPPDLSVTLHGPGDMYVPHVDRGEGYDTRRLSYVYYLHREPKAFTGGDLVLLDGGSDALAYTRLSPVANSLVLFPSDRVHGVTRLGSCPDDPLAGRWTLHGWFHAQPSGDTAA